MIQYFVVDAFTDQVFSGNPAGVCLLNTPLDDAMMQNIASENNLAETAFIVPKASGYHLRWFTPEVEIDLCGHATLASAYVISKYVNPTLQTIRFDTLSGVLEVSKQDDLFRMDFPSRKPKPVPVTSLMERAIGHTILEASVSRDLLLLVDEESTLLSIQPNFQLLREIPDCFAVIVTAKGDKVDFVSRFFAPNAGIPEDPVTGSSHSTLIPFWAERLGKQQMIAKQLSKRGGTIYCKNDDERVIIAGKAVLYSSGEIHL